MENAEVTPTNQVHNQVTQPQSTCKCKVLSVYLFLISGLFISAVTVGILSNVEFVVDMIKDHFMITMIIISILMTINTNIFNRIPYSTRKGCKSVCWILNCVMAAVPLLKIEQSVLATSVIYTLVLFLILSLLSFIIPQRVVETYVHPLTIVHTGVLVCTVYSMIFNTSEFIGTKVVMAGCLYGGFLVYAGLLICNTHRLCLNIKHPYFDPMFSAFVFYMNILNIYSRFTAFTGKHLTFVIKEKNGCNCKK